MTHSSKAALTGSYGCGVGLGCGCPPRFSLGGAGLLLSGFCVPLGAVVVESSGVGCLRFSVGRPGVPSSLPAITPLEVIRAFDSRKRRFFTRLNSQELMTDSSRPGKRGAQPIAAARRPSRALRSLNILYILPVFLLLF